MTVVAQSPPQIPPPVPLFRIMFGNATLLSAVYLAVGVVVEIVSHLFPTNPWVARATLVLDSLPARSLELLGLMDRIRAAYGHDRISEVTLRLIFSGTTVAIIFAMALIVGAGMWLMRRFLYRRYSEP
ncbi:MAG: hypothetical protein IRZ16_18360 [Myxococcaceae bacterium]|nr:hypothetical protein [Myxococcaceae bacterium]